ncbi:DEAD/DEAH box helicase [Nitrosovibrio tenuis]|uniref:DEAD/DEAH box helicase n=1 Tax=Nitrosovibrio tenuis TaxID=1233 RepID=A0A1H7LJ72_9PROT|nr:DEAD/DEAH box helicase [Nitrosovibrio tenuis]SEK98427.1 DEAD/DEAH box helicase [Nitrosovibrio tenuis]
MDIFDTCSRVNDLFELDREVEARDKLIQLLDYLEKTQIPYSELVNRLIRRSGLYPYLKTETATWEDRCAYEAFKVDVGLELPVTLHREQSSVLKQLIDGKNIAVSAPTSFGKSFIIDAFISLKQPKNVVIIVPTLALTDETRRRLQQKFSGRYKIITTGDVPLGERNILVFPQERAIHYANLIQDLDLLVIDEFYKASPVFDKERSPALLRAILRLGDIAKQKYFLAPNISDLKGNFFTKGMEFALVNFNTVFLEKHELYRQMGKNEERKSQFLIQLLQSAKSKTLVYAATYSNISSLSTLLIDKLPTLELERLHDFEAWLSTNYGRNWHLTKLVKRGVGIHNGQLHRSLSQIQIRLFEDPDGLDTIVSTSSIIEGVNTSAENIVIWSNKKGGRGNPKLDDFTYKNIIGRGARMFRHFVGKIYILEEPPATTNTQLELTLPDQLLGSIDEVKYSRDLTPEQIAKIAAYKEEMRGLLHEDSVAELLNGNELQSSNSTLIRDIASAINSNAKDWNGLGYLNSENPEDWDRLLYKTIRLRSDIWGTEHHKIVAFMKVISNNWTNTIPEMLEELNEYDIGLDEFFKLERTITHNLASLLSDVNLIYRKITKTAIDISPFAARVSFAFLPPNVFRLEEYGLPRMISRKIHHAGLIDLADVTLSLHDCIDQFLASGAQSIKLSVKNLDRFDHYVINHFFEGIQRIK